MERMVQTTLDFFEAITFNESKALAPRDSEKNTQEKMSREEAERFILERCRPIKENNEPSYWINFYLGQRNDNHETIQNVHEIHVSKMTRLFNEIMMKLFGEDYIMEAERL